MTPLITVLMPTLNAQEYLVGALDSLASQTLQDFKVLVLDGGSTDSTREIALSYQRVEFIQCGKVGLGATLRIGVEKVQTPLAARMDADDVCLPHRFATQAAALQNNALAIVGGQIDLLIGSKICRAQPLPRTHGEIRHALLAGFPAFIHPTVMFRTDLARRHRAYSIPGAGEDLDFFLRMTEAGLGINLSEVVLRYRIHEESSTFTSFDEVRRNYDYAVACASARRNGQPEPDPGSHAEFWTRRSWAARLATKAECFGVQLYRKSRVRLAEGQRLQGLAGAAISVAVRPRLIRTRARIALAALAGGESA